MMQRYRVNAYEIGKVIPSLFVVKSNSSPAEVEAFMYRTLRFASILDITPVDRHEYISESHKKIVL